jgi:hypothetical protein
MICSAYRVTGYSKQNPQSDRNHAAGLPATRSSQGLAVWDERHYPVASSVSRISGTQAAGSCKAAAAAFPKVLPKYPTLTFFHVASLQSSTSRVSETLLFP